MLSKDRTQFDRGSQKSAIALIFAILFVSLACGAGVYSYFTTETAIPVSKNLSPSEEVEIKEQEPEMIPPSPEVPQEPKGEVAAAEIERSLGYYGISTGQTFSGLSTAELNAAFADLATIGVGWIRFDIDWSEVEPSETGPYNWRNIDRIVAAANAKGVHMVATLGYTPPWARIEGCPTSKCAPRENAEFARFAAAAVKRYSTKGIKHWEVWNEPNLVSFWQPEPDVGDYTILLKSAYEAIKSVDKDAVVISGGLGPIATGGGNVAPLEFITRLYEEGGGDYFDAVGFHPYTFPVLPSYTKSWNAWSQMSATSPSVRSIMVANGDGGKKIWMTEFGAPTGGPGTEATLSNYTRVQHPSYVSDELQARMLTDALTLAENYEWAGPVFWYSYQDLGTSSNTIENFFGLRRYDGSAKPSYTALQHWFEAL